MPCDRHSLRFLNGQQAVIQKQWTFSSSNIFEMYFLHTLSKVRDKEGCLKNACTILLKEYYRTESIIKINTIPQGQVV